MTNHDTLPIYDAADVTIARTIEDLPKLSEGYVRVVHLTHPSIAEKIVAISIANAFGSANRNSAWVCKALPSNVTKSEPNKLVAV